jgi:hypothetical protein
MVFIDGGWLYRNRSTLFAKLGEENFEIDYAKLPRLFCEDVANRLDEDLSLVRTNYFGTIPSARSGFNTSKQYAFYDFLERSCGYETDIHEVEVGTDENWIKMSLSAALLFYAAQPGAYDIAILIGDDPDYAPVLRRARLFGKRVQVVGAHSQDIPSSMSLANRIRVSDFPLLYLDDHAAEMRLVRELVKRTCKQCGCEENTTWAGPEFFCSSCRGRYRS